MSKELALEVVMFLSLIDGFTGDTLRPNMSDKLDELIEKLTSEIVGS